MCVYVSIVKPTEGRGVVLYGPIPWASGKIGRCDLSLSWTVRIELLLFGSGGVGMDTLIRAV